MSSEALLEYLSAHGLGTWAESLRAQSSGWLVEHGDYPRWKAAVDALPGLDDIEADLDLPAVTIRARSAPAEELREALRGLMPWRKGPFDIAGVQIDSEWRSDLKWARVAPALAPLQGRRILDIGCGNGYYGWRMLAQSPAMVVGVEPSVLYNLQFEALQKYLRRPEIALLPVGVDDLPESLEWFDTVFSMGVLYHRRSPLDHLLRLRDFLLPGGELCLETLVVEGGEGRVLVPRGRYARMRNVWFIPSAAELSNWLERCGFLDIHVVDESLTTTDEQRATEWMQFESLERCLDPEDTSRTVEGLPAPRRAVLLARKPGTAR